MASSEQHSIQTKGNLNTRITKETTVFNLGHLPSHVDGKTDAMRAVGFVNAKPLYCQTTTGTSVFLTTLLTPLIHTWREDSYMEILYSVARFI